MHKCSFCPKTYRTTAGLHGHQQRAHINRPKVYKCAHCDFVANAAPNLKAHIVRKHATKPFQCTLCPYGTMLEKSLQRHIQTHNEDRPFVCGHSECFHRSRSKEALRLHIQEAHGTLRKHPCATCGKRFKSLSTLKSHVHTHTGEKHLACPHCPFRSCHRSTIYRHVTKMHPNKVPQQAVTTPQQQQQHQQQQPPPPPPPQPPQHQHPHPHQHPHHPQQHPQQQQPQQQQQGAHGANEVVIEVLNRAADDNGCGVFETTANGELRYIPMMPMIMDPSETFSAIAALHH